MPASSIKSRKQKGKALEDYVAQRLRETGIDPRARRSLGSGSGTREKADIETSAMIGDTNIGIECKHTDKPKLLDWWRQARKLEQVRRVPILVWKQTGDQYTDTKAIISMETLLQLIETQADVGNYNNKEKPLTSDFRRQLDDVLYAIKHLENEDYPKWRKKDAQIKIKKLIKTINNIDL